ncbi:hypothetical protein Nepgr_001960 [Nepenthes gracilis]|uniref:Mannan endo-1,4-beta-mannosidase n=1 Tax=Nepenthes gracilis TaxID=150966 RepID=A0AAD3P612_NEPGR|nr:hypothetical protein Nepgr_001960 [Nepenthes gracilis]
MLPRRILLPPLVVIAICCSQLLVPCYGRRGSAPIRAVNLGGWLVTEGWITPRLFSGIPNGDLLDGTQVQLKSVTTGKYLCAEDGGGTIIVANRSAASGWETFRLWRVNEDHFNFKVFSDRFWGMDTSSNGNIVAVATKPGDSETFEIVRNPNNRSLVRIRAPNGSFIQAKSEVLVTPDYTGNQGWGDDDPSVFTMNAFGALQGEFQVTNGWGPDKAPQVMQNHWNTFVVEDDFKFISENGLNAVRIPVGWWIASDPTPPKPFVGGSLDALDKAFAWAKKHGIQVIIDLHAAPGSQNGNEHSASRDGSQEWGKTEANIQQTVGVINFLTARYANWSCLLGIELINEPLAPGVTFDSLSNYYKQGYDAVRSHTADAYVIMSVRLGQADQKELYPMIMDNKYMDVAIDVHYYNLFSDIFNNMTVQQNIDYINKKRASDLNYLLHPSGGPQVFIGEWVAEWQVQGANKSDYKRFAAAQMEVYGRATFGWSYWTLKCQYLHWDLERMIQQGYMALPE